MTASVDEGRPGDVICLDLVRFWSQSPMVSLYLGWDFTADLDAYTTNG